MKLRATLALACLVAASDASAEVYRARTGMIEVTTVASGLVNPWAVAFLPDGRALVTERPGRMRVVATDGRIGAALRGVPAVHARVQGGLLDLVLDPDFARTRTLYFTFSEPEGGESRTAVARARFEEDRLADVRVIFRQQPRKPDGYHFGSRIVVARDGRLFVALGERGFRDEAQLLSGHLGKVVRIAPDGSVPPDNPFVGRSGALPEIWSYGHRNVQGAALHPLTGALWTAEHGARGGDEINIPLPGRNYGWPVITYGRDYSGVRIGEGTAKPGMEQPIHYWDPSIAPSGMAFYTGDRFPAWRGDLLVGALAGQRLMRLKLDGDRVIEEETLLSELRQRIRDVRQGPDGNVYLLTDASDGRLLRVAPAPG